MYTLSMDANSFPCVTPTLGHRVQSSGNLFQALEHNSTQRLGVTHILPHTQTTARGFVVVSGTASAATSMRELRERLNAPESGSSSHMMCCATVSCTHNHHLQAQTMFIFYWSQTGMGGVFDFSRAGMVWWYGKVVWVV